MMTSAQAGDFGDGADVEAGEGGFFGVGRSWGGGLRGRRRRSP